MLIDPDVEEPFTWKMKREIEERIVSTLNNEIFVFYSGKGIKHLHDHDEQTKISFENLKKRFDFIFSPNVNGLGLKYMHLDEQISFFNHQLFADFDFGENSN